MAGASLVFDVAIALSLLGLGNSGVGYLNATLGIGGFIGGFVALLLAQRGRLARNFGIGVLFWAAPLLLVAAWPTVGAAVAVMIMLGLANSVVDVNAYTILQRVTPEAVMARVFGAMESAVIGGMAVGALLMPILIETIGLRWGLVVVGAGVSVLVLLGMRGLRRIDLSTFAPPELELLRKVSLLSLLPEPTLEALARALTRVEVAAGEAFIREGDHGDVFYVVETGSVEVTKEGRHVATLGPGDYVGEIALLRDVPRTATVTATERVRPPGTRPRALHPGSDRPGRIPRRGRRRDRHAAGDALRRSSRPFSSSSPTRTSARSGPRATRSSVSGPRLPRSGIWMWLPTRSWSPAISPRTALRPSTNSCRSRCRASVCRSTFCPATTTTERNCAGVSVWPGQRTHRSSTPLTSARLRLVLMDSTRPGEDRGELDSSRIEWLDGELAAAPDRPTLLAMHHPPIVTGSPAWDAIGLPGPARSSLAEVVARHPQVLGIVAGHHHQMIVAELGSRPVMAIPSTYGQARVGFGASKIVFGEAVSAFAVHVLADGALASSVQFVPYR